MRRSSADRCYADGNTSRDGRDLEGEQIIARQQELVSRLAAQGVRCCRMTLVVFLQSLKPCSGSESPIWNAFGASLLRPSPKPVHECGSYWGAQYYLYAI